MRWMESVAGRTRWIGHVTDAGRWRSKSDDAAAAAADDDDADDDDGNGFVQVVPPLAATVRRLLLVSRDASWPGNSETLLASRSPGHNNDIHLYLPESSQTKRNNIMFKRTQSLFNSSR